MAAFLGRTGILMVDTAALSALIEPEAQALGFDLVRVKMTGGKSDPTLQVMAERPDTRQLTIDDCSALSHRISDRLDALEAAGRDPMPEAYRLEVSSPGIDRPLTRLTDFADWAGHEARIRLTEAVDGRKQVTGDLAGVEDGRITIDLGQHGTVVLTMDQIDNAKLVMTDRLIAATQALSMEGADELEDASDEQDSSTPAEDNH